MKNFQIGSEIVRVLSESEELTNAVGKKIFPLIANADTTFPFIRYRRSGYRPANTKDGIGEVVIIDLQIAATKYDDSVRIANAVADKLIGTETDIILDIQIVNTSEDFLEDTYIQTIQIEIEIK